MNAQSPSFPARAKNLSLIVRPSRPLSLAAAAALLLGACVVYPRREVVVRQAPPPVVVEQPAYPIGTEIVTDTAPPTPLAEVITAPPAVGYIWIPGAWEWNGRWVWAAGRWAYPPRPGAVWVPHHYENRNGVHVFIRGGWR